ncbi:DUF2169 family type VI secretion system accessory protein [Lampropedia aestuarii]|uniref:DUF2169 family type VI secretion system accessory protein n=1 Tax=Lampropedia aestuarii TaxID=2562762 RepID=UPI0024695FAC|nr:DUF2169 domain-containing protein [Lampropedia aestuarii]MDH5857379.1 DUF2169 domain-containing protein [Lampropedia aestuarii]
MTKPPYVLESGIQAAALPEIRNHTQFPSQYFQMMDSDDHLFHVLVSRVSYDLLNLDANAMPRLAKTQTPLVQADQFYGQPNTSALIQESDFAPYKPQCDIVFAHANAYAPGEQAVQRWPVGVRVGDWSKLLMVCGPRTMAAGLMGYKLSEPAPAIQVPLRYELAFGGAQQPDPTLPTEPAGAQAMYLPNPIGCGWLGKAGLQKTKQAAMRAPQIEVFNQALDDAALARQNYPVIGLGAIGRWWQPRVDLTGTYDAVWQEHRWPRLPKDANPAYWNCAPEDQQIAWPKGGEEILLAGLTPGGGRFKAKLPDQPPYALARLHAGPILPRSMHLDTLLFDMHTMTLSCVHRMLIAADAGVRVLEIRRKED